MNPSIQLVTRVDVTILSTVTSCLVSGQRDTFISCLLHEGHHLRFSQVRAHRASVPKIIQTFFLDDRRTGAGPDHKAVWVQLMLHGWFEVWGGACAACRPLRVAGADGHTGVEAEVWQQGHPRTGHFLPAAGV